jgi:TolB-like protein/tRNA A-37 threonylcarbamoyl transferase component Bud32/Tfp pilus assembly protein PilF
MGVVYRAHDEKLDRDVALKVLPQGTLADEEARERFHREARMLSKLNHPNIATVHDFDTQDGTDFLVMEYVSGKTLDEVLGRGPLAEKELARLGVQLAQGLVAAHEAGVVHRDLKPGNLRITSDGRLKILDFGLAKLLESAREVQPGTGSMETAATVTLSKGDSAAAGTLPYMAPEQLRGEKIDARSDLYAAGAVLFEMATGRRAFAETQAPRLITAILSQAPPALQTLNPRASPVLEGIVQKALEKDPELRYQSARDLRVDLERLAAPTPLLQGPRPAPSPRQWTRVAVACGVVLALVLGGLRAGGWSRRFFAHRAPGPILALAVLPLENLSHNPEQEYFADGMTDQLITDLAQIGALKVISRTSVMGYKATHKLLPEIARELGVDAIVEGSVQHAGDRVRITAQLIRAATDEHLWAASYDRNVRDYLTLQSELAQAIADTIRIQVAPRERAAQARTRAVDPKALEAYLKGRYHADRNTKAEFTTAIENFEGAIAIDPTYAAAYAGLARCYYGASTLYLPPDEAMPKARAAATRALEIDADQYEAHVALAYVKSFYDWKWKEGEKDLRRAIELLPGDAEVHRVYCEYLIANERFDEAIREIQRARELDPLSLMIQVVALWPLNEGRRYDETIEAARKLLETHPDCWDAHLIQGQAYLEKKEYAKAIAAMRKASELEGETDPYLRLFLGAAYARAGQRGEASRILEQVMARPEEMEQYAYGVATLYAGLGDKDRAFQWLGKSIERRLETVIFLQVDPQLDSLRSDPRFKVALHQLGFE